MSKSSKEHFSKRVGRKKVAKKRFGKIYTDLFIESVNRYSFAKLETALHFSENSPVDYVWDELSLGIECKRLKETKFMNRGHAKAWLTSEVINRFVEYEEQTGLNLKYRVLCVSEKKWDKTVDVWLVSQGYYLMETGQIDTVNQGNQASESVLVKFSMIMNDIEHGIINPRCL